MAFGQCCWYQMSLRYEEEQACSKGGYQASDQAFASTPAIAVSRKRYSTSGTDKMVRRPLGQLASLCKHHVHKEFRRRQIPIDLGSAQIRALMLDARHLPSLSSQLESAGRSLPRCLALGPTIYLARLAPTGSGCGPSAVRARSPPNAVRCRQLTLSSLYGFRHLNAVALEKINVEDPAASHELQERKRQGRRPLDSGHRGY